MSIITNTALRFCFESISPSLFLSVYNSFLFFSYFLQLWDSESSDRAHTADRRLAPFNVRASGRAALQPRVHGTGNMESLRLATLTRYPASHKTLRGSEPSGSDGVRRSTYSLRIAGRFFLSLSLSLSLSLFPQRRKQMSSASELHSKTSVSGWGLSHRRNLCFLCLSSKDLVHLLLAEFSATPEGSRIEPSFNDPKILKKCG